MQENKYDGEPPWLIYSNFHTVVILVLKIVSKIKNQETPFRGEIDHLSKQLLLVLKTTSLIEFGPPESKYGYQILNNATYMEIINNQFSTMP